jgi:hypothetical protein
MESLFSWEFESRFERGKQWYIIAATLVITAIIVSFLIGSFLFGIVMIIFTGVYLLYDINSHPTVQVNVGADGVMIDGDIYSYTRIQSFTIMRVNNQPIIIRLKLTSKTIPTLDLLLAPTLDLSSLRSYIASYTTEEPETNLPFIEHLLLGLRL